MNSPESRFREAYQILLQEAPTPPSFDPIVARLVVSPKGRHPWVRRRAAAGALFILLVVATMVLLLTTTTTLPSGAPTSTTPSADTVDVSVLPTPPELWSAEGVGITGTNIGNLPRVVLKEGGLVYVAGGSQQTVTALDGTTGETSWSRSIGGGVVGLLYADDDLVLARGYGLVQALHPLTGESLWRLELGGEYWPIEAFRSSAGVHLLLDRPTDGDVEPPEVLTVDPMDGSELWTTVLDGVDHPDLDLQPEGSALYDDQLLVKSTGALHALDADSGEVNWHLRFGAIPESYGRAPLLIADNLVVVPDPNGELAVVDLADGQDVWRRSVAEGKVAAVGILGDLLIYTDGQGIHGAAISTGEMRWSEPTSRASASLIEDLLVVVGQGSVKALEPSSGALIWQIDTEFDLALAAMAIHPDLIAAVAEEGILAVTLSTGRVEWSIGTEEQPSQLIGGPIAEAPLIEDGVLIVAFSDGRVAAYVGDTG